MIPLLILGTMYGVTYYRRRRVAGEVGEAVGDGLDWLDDLFDFTSDEDDADEDA